MSHEMTERERKIREERASVYKDVMTPVLEKLDRGERLSVEDRKTFDDAELRLQDLDADLDLVAKAQKREQGRDEASEVRGISRDANDSEESKYTRAFIEYFKVGKDELTAEARQVLRVGEKRAELDSASLQTIPGQGGYMIPQGFWQNLQIALKQYGGLLPLCNLVKTASGNEMPWPTANPTGVVGQYITEANQVGFTDYTFGQGILYAWTITSGVILASLQLINDSAFNVDQFVSDRMGEAIGRKIAAELWSGAGSASKALTGLTTSISANGGSGSGSLSTPGYIQTTLGTKIFTLSSPSTAIAQYETGIVGWNDLTRMIGAVDVAYRQSGRCCWVMNDTQVQLERTLTDGYGHPLWEPNTQAGQPDVILGYPVVVDNNSPSVSTASTAVAGGITFGDFKTALVVRQVDMAGTMRLTERYADYLQVGYLGYVRMDSQPNDLRAVVQYETNTAS
jgi:HK97 family phage major capsid protein